MRWAGLGTVTIRAPRVRSSAGSSRAVNAQCPRWSTPNCISKPSAVLASGIPITPALLISRSMLLCAAMICAAAARTDACEARSSATSSSAASGALLRISPTAAAAFFWLRTAITTCAPFAASWRAVSSPSPPLAPVTTAVRPCWPVMFAALQFMMPTLNECSFGHSHGTRVEHRYKALAADSLGCLTQYFYDAGWANLACLPPRGSALRRHKRAKGLAVNWQEMLDGTVNGSFQHPALRRLALPNFSGWDSGRVWGDWDFDPEICNPDGALFGGYLPALADATAGHAMATTLGDGEGFATADFRISYHRPVRG